MTTFPSATLMAHFMSRFILLTRRILLSRYTGTPNWGPSFHASLLAAHIAATYYHPIPIFEAHDLRPGPGGVEPRLAVSVRPEGHR